MISKRAVYYPAAFCLHLKIVHGADRQWHLGPVTAENAGERLIIRSERETLTRLPKTQAILFTIRTYRRPLSDLEAQPDQALKLAAAIRALPPDVRDYKGLKAVGQAALGYLDRLQVTLQDPVGLRHCIQRNSFWRLAIMALHR